MFSKRLAEIRKKRGLSQYELADRLGFSRGQISNYEQGKREPDHETLTKIADFFDVSIDYLLGRTDDPTMNRTNHNEEIDLKEALTKEEKRAHWGGRELTEEERKLIQRIIQAAIEREESATHTD